MAWCNNSANDPHHAFI